MSKNDTKDADDNAAPEEKPSSKWAEDKFNFETEADLDAELESEQAQVEIDEELLAEVATDNPLQAKLVALATELEAERAKYLRLQADVQNKDRHFQSKLADAHRLAIDKFVNALLPVVDSLERGIEACDQDSLAAAKEGMTLTLKMFLDTLQKFSVDVLNPEGEKFDPSLHEAVSAQSSPDVPANTVITVLQKGYVLHGRVLRPAMVIVSN